MTHKFTVAKESAPPRTPEEIADAKEYLRKAFAHAVERAESYAKTPGEIRIREITDSLLKSRGMSYEEIAARHEDAMQGLRDAAREVPGRTPLGEIILDREIACWQALGELPPYLKRPGARP